MKLVVKVDEEGKVKLPKEVIEKAGLTEGSALDVIIDGNKIILTPAQSHAEKYFGIFRVEAWPDDLDEYVVEALRNWWKEEHT